MVEDLVSLIASKFSLSEDEAKVYGLLILHRVLTPGEVCHHTTLPLPKVSSILRSLKDKGLISQVPGVVERYVAITPFRALSEAAGNFLKTAEETNINLKKYSEAAKSDLERLVDSFKSKLKDSVLNGLQTLRGEVNKASELLERITQRNKLGLADTVKEVESYSSGQVESHKRLSEELLTKVKGEIKEEENRILDGTKNIIERSTEKASNTFAFMLDGVSTQLGEVERRVLKDISRISEIATLMPGKIAEKIVEAKGEFDSKARESFEAAKEGTSKAIDLLKCELDERTKTMEGLVSESIRKNIERRIGQANRLERELEKFIRSSTSDVAKTISSFYTSALRPLWSLSREHEKEVQGISERIGELMKAGALRLSSLIEDVKARIAEHIKTQVELQGETLKDFSSKVEEHVASSLKRFEEASSSAKERFSSVIMEEARATSEVFERAKRAVEALVSEHTDAMKSVLKKVEERVQASLTTEREAEEREFSKFKDAFSSMLEVSKHELIEAARLMSEGALKEIHAQTVEFIGELKKLRGKVSESVEKELKRIRWEAEEAKRDVERFLTQRIASMDEHAEQVKQQLERMIRERLEEVSISIGAVQAGFVEAMDKILVKFNEVVEEAKNGFSSSLATQLSFFRESLNRLGFMFADELRQQVDAAKAEANEVLSRFSEELEQRVLEVEAAANQIMENAETMFRRQERISRQLRDVFSSLLIQEAKRYIDSFSNTAMSLNERLASLIEARIKSLGKLRSKLEKEISSFVISEEAAIDEKSASLKEAMNSYISERCNEYVEAIKVAAREVEELLHEHVEQHKTYLEELLKSLSETIENTLGKISETSNRVMNEVAVRLDTEKEAITGEAKVLIENASRIFEQYLKNLRNSIAVSLNELLKEVSKQIESLNEERKRLEILARESIEADVKEFEEGLRSLEGALASNVKSEKEKAISTITQLESKLQGLLSKVKEELDAYSENVKEESTSILEQYSKEAIGILEVTGKSVTECLEESRRIFGTKADEIKGLINGLVEETLKEITEITRETYERIVALAKRYNEETERGVQETRSRLISEFKAHVEKQEKDMEGFSRKVVETLFQLVESYGKTLEELNNGVTLHLSEFYEKAAERLKSAIDIISENMSVLFEELKAIEAIARSAWDELVKAPLSIEGTCFIATREAVQVRMKDMATRAKRSLIMIAPKLEELPVEELLKIEPSVRVYVFTDFDLSSNLNIVKSLISKNNIRLWRREEKEFLMCLRDNEEILIATVSKEEPILAIVSEEHSYIEAYKRTLIPLLRSTSKEVKARDIDVN